MSRDQEVDALCSAIDDLKKVIDIRERLTAANNLCAMTTGLEEFPANNEARKVLLRELEAVTLLSRWEFICLHGYEAWRKYVDENKLPEDHPYADR